MWARDWSLRRIREKFSARRFLQKQEAPAPRVAIIISLIAFVAVAGGLFASSWWSTLKTATSSSPEIPAIESKDLIASGEQLGATEPAPSPEACIAPTGLTDMQQAVPFEDCEFVIIETLDDGSLGLVSGRSELFQQILDSDTTTYEDSPRDDQRARSPITGGSRSQVPGAEANSSEAPPLENFDTGGCPVNRSENPSRYDACRAGYSAPSIVPIGIVSCTPLNGERTTWDVTIALELQGGNYRDPGWAGVSNSSGSTGYISFTVDGLGEESLNQILPAKYVEVSVSMGSMDSRYEGFADIIHYANDVEADFSPCL